MKLIKKISSIIKSIKNNLNLVMGIWVESIAIFIIVLVKAVLTGKFLVSSLFAFEPAFVWGLSFTCLFLSIRVLPKKLRKNHKRISSSDIYFSALNGYCTNKYQNYFMNSKIMSKTKKKAIIFDLLNSGNKCLLSRHKHKEKTTDDFFRIVSQIISQGEVPEMWSLDILTKFFSNSQERTDIFINWIRIEFKSTSLYLLEDVARLSNSVKSSKYLKLELFNCIGDLYSFREQRNYEYMYGKSSLETINDRILSNLNGILDSPEIDEEDLKSLVLRSTATNFSRSIVVNHHKCPRTVAITGALMGTK